MRKTEKAGGAHAAAGATLATFTLSSMMLLSASAGAIVPAPCIDPPALLNPIVYSGKCPEDAGGPLNVNARGRDVLVNLPTTKVCGKRLSIVGANNIRIYGGKFVFTGTDPQVVSIGSSSGVTFIDGLHIDVNRKYADAIRFYRHTGSAVIQNTRIEGVSGVEAGTHGDVVHAQGDGPLTKLTLENVTGLTGYQGLFVPYRPESGHGTRQLQLNRVNLGYDPEVIVTKPLMLLYFGSFYDSVDPPPDLGTNLSDVFVDGTVRSFRFERAVYARPTLDGFGCATFAPAHKVTGKVCGGLHSLGDFAPAAAVGLAYNRGAFCTIAPITAGIR
jgi:hypothetical protein